jgi:hypothetical protein
MSNRMKLTEPEQALLQAVFDHFDKTCEWPISAELNVQFRKSGGLWSIAEKLGNRIIDPGQRHNQPSQVQLTVKGIWLCENSEALLNIFIRALKLCVARFIEIPSAPKISGSELFTELKIEYDDLRKVYILLKGEWNIRGSINNDNDPILFEMSLNERVMDFEDITNIDDYVKIAYPSPNQILPKLISHNEIFYFNNMSFNLKILQYLPELISDDKLKNVIIQDSNELMATIESSSWKCVCILCGSICEALLFDHLLPIIPAEIQDMKKNDKATLKNLIDKAVQQGLIQKYVRGMLDAVREMRNLIHPALLVS